MSFTNPVTGETETVLDSSAMETKLGHIKSTRVKDLRTRSGVLVDKITEMENQLKSPTFEDKYPLIQANLNTAYDELEKISTELGGSYQRPSGDASPDTGGFWSGVFSSIGDAFTPSDEERFKAKTRKEKMGQVASGSVELPEGVSGYQWAQSEADRLWDEKVNFDPTPKSDAELRDISGRKE